MLVGWPWLRSPAPRQKPPEALPHPSATSARTEATFRRLLGPTLRMVEAAFEQNPTQKLLRHLPGLGQGESSGVCADGDPRWWRAPASPFQDIADAIKHQLRKSGSGRVLHLHKTMFKKEMSSQQL